jgi:hypothetical protein
MKQPDHDLENYLREFQPRQPRALPEIPQHKIWQWPRLAAAAILAIACGTATWFAVSRYPSPYRESPAQTFQEPANSLEFPAVTEKSAVSHIYTRAELQRLALEDPAKFDAALFAAAANSLPRFTEPNSLLSILAKD